LISITRLFITAAYRVTALSVVATGIACTSPSPPQTVPLKTTQALAAEIPGLMQQARIPGLSIAVIRRGEIAWVHNFGTVDTATQAPVTEHTQFSAASLSKPIFAYAVLQLVDEGKLDLDTPLVQYWPERITDDPRQAKITARMALSHRAGFPDWRPDGGPLEIHFTPGERFSYSGEGYAYLQKTIEHLEHKPLSEIMAQRVFAPLGMQRSTFVSQLGPNVANGYDAAGVAHPPYLSTGNAAYSLQTTAYDYALFVQAILNGHGLKPATLRAMETAQIAVDPSCTYCTQHAPKELSKTLFWGLGWGIEALPSGTYLWHWGDNDFYKAFVSVDLKRRNAVVYFSNSQNGLAIAPVLIRDAIGASQPALPWLGYDSYDSPGMHFMFDALRHGAEALNLHAAELAAGAISEMSLDSTGALLLDQKRYDDAIAVLAKNSELHAGSADAWASLGKAYAQAGKRDQAFMSFEKALALAPDNKSVQLSLDRLRQP